MLDILEIRLVKQISYIADYMEDKMENIEPMIVSVIGCDICKTWEKTIFLFSVSDNEYDRLYGIHIRFHISIDE